MKSKLGVFLYAFVSLLAHTQQLPYNQKTSDAFWSLREQAFADDQELQTLYVTQPETVSQKISIFYAELEKRGLGSLAQVLKQTQRTTKKILSNGSITTAPGEIKLLDETLKTAGQRDKQPYDLMLAPYIAQALCQAVAFERSLRPKNGEKISQELYLSLKTENLPVYAQWFAATFNITGGGERLQTRISPDTLPFLVTKTIIGESHNTLRDVYYYDLLLKKYPNKDCDQSYFHDLRHLDDLMKGDPHLVEQECMQIALSLYHLSQALHAATIIK